MPRVFKAIIGEDGQVRLLEPVDVGKARKVLVTVLDEPAEGETDAATAATADAAAPAGAGATARRDDEPEEPGKP